MASPRGYRGGRSAAVETVERLLDLHGPPIYVRKQIVHNAHVVQDLEERGAIFVESETEVPEGATIVLSAHGVAPSVYENAGARRLNTIDATCPLVTKVHVEARRYAADQVLDRADRPRGSRGGGRHDRRGLDAIVLIQTIEDAERVEFADPERVAYITQTTLSVDETTEIIAVLRRRFPAIRAPKRDDICYATSNRQWAVKDLLEVVDLLLVIGSRNSSNSNRLVEVARAGGAAHI